MATVIHYTPGTVRVGITFSASLIFLQQSLQDERFKSRTAGVQTSVVVPATEVHMALIVPDLSRGGWEGNYRQIPLRSCE